MKGIRKISAFITALAIGASTAFGVFTPQYVHAEAPVYQRYELAELETLIAGFEAAFGKSNNEQEVRQCYQLLVEEIDYIYSQSVLAMVSYSENMTEDNLDEYRYMESVNVLGINKVFVSLQKSLRTEYGGVIAELLGEILSDSLKNEDIAIDEKTEEFLAKKNELEQKYIEIAYSSLTEEDKNMGCAAVYLDLVKLYNSIMVSDEYTYLDYAYISYNRDYTADMMMSVGDTVRQSLIDSYYKLTEGQTYNKVLFENNFDVVSQYTYRMSEELGESADIILENNLYRTGSGGKSENKAYTTALPYYNTAIIYQYIYNNDVDFSSAVHEFGHFNAMRLNIIPSLNMQTPNLDVAEVHSQGLEVLYTKFYDDIYGAYADSYRAKTAANLLSAVAAGFVGNEFENYVYNNADTMTAADVVSLYEKTAEKYELYDVPLYRIPHFFQAPGYYVSYAVSALAALDLWDTVYRDFDKAVDIYTDFSHISNNSTTGFSEALETTGFDNIFESGLMEKKIKRLSSVISNGIVYGDIDENNTVNASDVLTLIRLVLDTSKDIEKAKRDIYDLNADEKINTADIIEMKRLLLR